MQTGAGGTLDASRLEFSLFGEAFSSANSDALISQRFLFPFLGARAFTPTGPAVRTRSRPPFYAQQNCVASCARSPAFLAALLHAGASPRRIVRLDALQANRGRPGLSRRLSKPASLRSA